MRERPYAVVEDFLVHNCGKKNRALIAKEREKFTAGCEANGYGAELGKQWFDIIEPFADYAFNKSHSFGYGFVAYQTAFLKANYPAEYLAALLTSRQGQPRQGRGLPRRVPHDGHLGRGARHQPVRERLHPGGRDRRRRRARPSASSSACPPCGTSARASSAHIVAEREANGPYADFYDFCQRVDTQVLNKRTVESLIKAGAFDDVGHPRKGLLTVFEQIVDHTVARRRERDMGIMTLFGGGDDGGPGDDFERTAIPDIEFDKRDRLAFEKEMLGPLRQRPPPARRGGGAVPARRRHHRRARRRSTTGP